MGRRGALTPVYISKPMVKSAFRLKSQNPLMALGEDLPGLLLVQPAYTWTGGDSKGKSKSTAESLVTRLSK